MRGSAIKRDVYETSAPGASAASLGNRDIPVGCLSSPTGIREIISWTRRCALDCGRVCVRACVRACARVAYGARRGAARVRNAFLASLCANFAEPVSTLSLTQPPARAL
jgi:hypothetical protein